MKSFFIDPAEAACGAIFIGFGAFFALQSFGLEIGTAFRMGPGYFPLVLAIVLILLGSVIFFRATRVQGDVIGAIAWAGDFFHPARTDLFRLHGPWIGFRTGTVFQRAYRSLRLAQDEPADGRH